MSLKDSLDKITSKTVDYKVPRVEAWLQGLSESDRQVALSAILNPAYGHAALTGAFAENGLVMSKEGFGRWRRDYLLRNENAS